jgi:curved DNA-binding protein CbpA
MLDVDCYGILELEPRVSQEELHQSYKDLAFVWHPDRFMGNARLQRKAHEKLQQINAAYAQLRSLRRAAQATVSPPPVSKPSSRPQPAANPQNFHEPRVNSRDYRKAPQPPVYVSRFDDCAWID